MREVEVRPLTAERWADFEKLFGPRGAYAGCWCMWPRLRSKDFNATNAGADSKEACGRWRTPVSRRGCWRMSTVRRWGGCRSTGASGWSIRVFAEAKAGGPVG